MKKAANFIFCLFAMVCTSNYTFGQTNLGKSNSFFNRIKSDVTNAVARNSDENVIALQITNSRNLKARINYKKSTPSSEFLIGEIKNVPQSSFYLKAESNALEGHIILRKTKEAYKYYIDSQGNAQLKKVSIHSLICIDYRNVPDGSTQKSNLKAAPIAQALLNLQSLPGAAGCIMLDFDGYNMPAGNLWNNGNAINAAPSGMSDADVQQHWEVVAEDYRPFNLNVTTNESVFNSYPRNRRMRVVITPTNTAAPGAGGVAYIGSFNWDNDVPCWVFITSGKSGGDASSHEVGHTFDLGHDGRTSPVEEYFVGLNNTAWAPIMGAGYYRPIVQWSKGEYNAANNKQDDVAIIAGSKFGVGYRGDDHGNSTETATNLDYNTSGVINQKSGLISSAADYDFFTFTTGGGNVVINATTVGRDGNLHLLMRLYNSAGAEIGTYWNADAYALNATMNVNLAAGKYYVGVDGNGAGDAGSGGYSSYGSVGSFWINGTIPPGGNINPSVDVVTAYKDCNYNGFSGGLTIGDYNLSQLKSLGLLNDDMSSLRIAQGYKVILYQDDNFTGTSITLTSNTSCFDNTWNDRVTSLRVLANGVTNLGGVTYFLQNRYSGLNMDVWGLSQSNGANVAQGTPNGGNNQKYTFTHLGDGLYKIIVNHSGQSLDINNFSKADGANVEQYPYNGTNNQQFILVSTADGFYKIIARHSGKVVEVAAFSTANGGNVQQWENANQTSGHWKLITTTANQSSTLIQAEDFSAMNGIQTEVTTDTNGGLNVAYCDTGDWMAYNNIVFPTSGSYLIEYRVASNMAGSAISSDLNAGSIILGTVPVPNTAGWQNWQTVSHTVNINAGTYNFGVFIQSTGVNLNWIRITKVGASAIINDETQAVAKKLNIRIYPNPAEDILYFSSDIENAKATIFDPVLGKIVRETAINQNSIDVSSLKSGLYILSIDFNGETASRKFIKK